MILSSGRQRFPAGHAYTRPAGQDRHVLELTLEGTMLRRSGQLRRFRPQPNQALILTPPGVPYALRGEVTGLELWVVFAPREPIAALLDWPCSPDFGVPLLRLAQSPAARQIVGAFEETLRHADSRQPHHELLAENALERLLLLAAGLARDLQAPPPDPRVQQAIACLEDHYREPLSVPDLARRVGLSPSRLAHLFRAATGDTPMAWLERLRLDQAQQLLLRTDLAVKQIAWRVGFDDPCYFTTRFRRRFGKPPSAWRVHPG